MAELSSFKEKVANADFDYQRFTDVIDTCSVDSLLDEVNR